MASMMKTQLEIISLTWVGISYNPLNATNGCNTKDIIQTSEQCHIVQCHRMHFQTLDGEQHVEAVH